MPLDAKSIGSGAEGRLRQSEIAQLLHRFGDLPSREIRGKVVCAVRHHVQGVDKISGSRPILLQMSTFLLPHHTLILYQIFNLTCILDANTNSFLSILFVLFNTP